MLFSIFSCFDCFVFSIVSEKSKLHVLWTVVD